jgi:hypothetical protein
VRNASLLTNTKTKSERSPPFVWNEAREKIFQELKRRLLVWATSVIQNIIEES